MQIHNLKSSVSVIIVEGMGFDLDGRRFFVDRDIFSRLQSIQTCSRSHPFSYPMGTGGHFPEVKRKECEADHSLPSNAEVKNCGAILPLHLLMG
jgi:hypothetical protein